MVAVVGSRETQSDNVAAGSNIRTKCRRGVGELQHLRVAVILDPRN